MKPIVRMRRRRREAIVVLALAGLAIYFVSPTKILAWANRHPKRINRFIDGNEVDGVAAAVEEVASKPWIRAACLARALAAQAMLRRRGVASHLCLGVNRADTKLAAHAWIEFREAIVVGGSEAAAFKRVAVFGN
jgi:hypothetical protein